MSKIYFTVFCLCLSCFELSAQWNYVGGTPGISPGQADYNSIAFDKNGKLYVGFHDDAEMGQLIVKTFNGTSWEILGTPQWAAESGQTYQVRLAIDTGGTPYAFFADYNYGGVRKFSNGNWSFVGDSEFTQVRPDLLQMAIAANGTPYVIFSDYYGNYMATVMKFDGQKWDTVGSRYLSSDQAQYDGIATDANSTPYIVFSDNSQQLKATVMKFNGTTWDYLGTPGFTPGEADFTSIAIDHNGIPYVAFVDQTVGQASVMKYVGGSWIYAGNAHFTGLSALQSSVTGLTLAIDNNNIPYVAFSDTTTLQAVVMSLTNGTWSYVGAHDFSSADADYLQLAISPTTNIPYVAFTDGGSNDQTSVMRYGNAAGIAEEKNDIVMRLYPNPASNLIHLTTTGFTPETITIFDLRGQQVSTGKYTLQLDVTNLTTGVYFVELKGENGLGVVRFEKM